MTEPLIQSSAQHSSSSVCCADAELAEPLDWRQAHRELSRLAEQRAELDREEGRWLLYALRSRAHQQLGYGTFAEYVQRLFGYKPRTTEEKLRVAQALERLPQLDQALHEGVVNWSTVRELTRVATPDNEGAWLGCAQGRTLREVEQLVAGRRPGDGPEAPADPNREKSVLRFEVQAETLALFRDAMAKLARDAGGRLDDDSALLLMARHVLGGPTDEGRASYQVALTVCSECQRGWMQGRGELVEVSPEMVELCQCDAQSIGRVDSVAVAGAPVDAGNANGAGDPPSLSRAPVGADNVACTGRPEGIPCGAERALEPTAGNPPAGNPAACDPCRAAPPKTARAKQTIPPAVRRQVIRRDSGRCCVPGCRSSLFVDVHHLEPRSEGGQHDPDTLLCLCGAHHRAHPRGQLIIQGRVSAGLSFCHADGTRYGETVSPEQADTHACVFRMLRGMGFRETQARQALGRVRAEARVDLNSTEQVLRAALAVLTPAARVA